MTFVSLGVSRETFQALKKQVLECIYFCKIFYVDEIDFMINKPTIIIIIIGNNIIFTIFVHTYKSVSGFNVGRKMTTSKCACPLC